MKLLLVSKCVEKVSTEFHALSAESAPFLEDAWFKSFFNLTKDLVTFQNHTLSRQLGISKYLHIRFVEHVQQIVVTILSMDVEVSKYSDF